MTCTCLSIYSLIRIYCLLDKHKQIIIIQWTKSSVHTEINQLFIYNVRYVHGALSTVYLKGVNSSLFVLKRGVKLQPTKGCELISVHVPCYQDTCTHISTTLCFIRRLWQKSCHLRCAKILQTQLISSGVCCRLRRQRASHLGGNDANQSL